MQILTFSFHELQVCVSILFCSADNCIRSQYSSEGLESCLLSLSVPVRNECWKMRIGQIALHAARMRVAIVKSGPPCSDVRN